MLHRADGNAGIDGLHEGRGKPNLRRKPRVAHGIHHSRRQGAGGRPRLKGSSHDTGHIEIGWGDKGFCQARKITAGLAVRAICWPTESVIHAVAVPGSPPEYFPTSELVQLSLDDKDFVSLVQFIAASFRRDAEGKIIPLGKGLYGDSQFYEGSGSYHLMNTCNKWTAKGIRRAGVDISPTFKLTAGSVMGSVKSRPPPERGIRRPIAAKR